MSVFYAILYKKELQFDSVIYFRVVFRSHLFA